MLCFSYNKPNMPCLKGYSQDHHKENVQESRTFFWDTDQFGFRAGLGTHKALTVMRTLCDQNLEVQKEVSIMLCGLGKSI